MPGGQELHPEEPGKLYVTESQAPHSSSPPTLNRFLGHSCVPVRVGFGSVPAMATPHEAAPEKEKVPGLEHERHESPPCGA